jgi:hypothetical protein
MRSLKRAARICTVLTGATVAACFSKPGAPHAGDGGTDPGDARKDGGGIVDVPDAPPACGTQDNFNNAAISNCETWGNATISSFATITRPNGTLDFNFAQGTASASCTTKAPFKIANGTSVHIVQYANYQTSFSLSFAGMATTFNVTYNGSMYSYNVLCTGQIGTTPSMSSSPPGWVQMRVTGSNPTRVIVELSTTGDAGTWSYFEDCSFGVTGPTTADVTMSGSGSGSYMARFDDFNIKNCPPP